MHSPFSHLNQFFLWLYSLWELPMGLALFLYMQLLLALLKSGFLLKTVALWEA